MPLPVPDLSLTHGQLLWALSVGRDPDTLTKDQARYLRQLEIPHKAVKSTPGSGNRIRYGFHDLVELGVAMRALTLRFRPKDIASVIVDDRDRFRQGIVKVWEHYPDDILSQQWVKSRGKIKVLSEAFGIVRLHDRRSEKWGKLDIAWSGDEHLGVDLLDPVERFEDGDVRALIPLSRFIAPWVAWALEAPEQRRGPM